ncbi:MAG: DEAD/DEAH box helicase family protein [Pseudanabaena sp. M38BS1SP1A06MG]|nr:DEAD/DEAH box helicase family protein [Pseudanabaena sp. M53BS1SP1A06MG]MCA6592878.1 DEAD/DEAH box helicase family protein [Pseudanabaena sp. M38BS1SP1A06MG]
MTRIFKKGDRVTHAFFGTGEVRLDDDVTVIVRFDSGDIQECPKHEIKLLQSLQEALLSSEWHDSTEVLAKIQALAVRSINDVWGVFSLARIDLLPHQLWVCRRVVQEMPTRWLVADDVGLGKTIEAGLILWTLLNKGVVKRILILCPASLVEQWQYRLRTMFDIRLTKYTTEADTPKSDFWNTNHQVVASLPTLRKDSRGRHKRMFEAEPWDLLIIDEAHHLNADEKEMTLGYSFIDRLINEFKRVKSAVFFSGTPHRGKHYQFFALLKLLRDDLFNPKLAVSSEINLQTQMRSLRHVMLRNNKQSVTDMKGKKLFSPHTVSSETYSYSESEAEFYEKLTEFILTGKAYASGLDDFNQRAVMLILTCMQKLASSSVAAIRRALERRLQRNRENLKKLEVAQQQKQKIDRTFISQFEEEDIQTSDELSQLEEEILVLTENLRLVENEIPWLEDLINAAQKVETETKIIAILNILETRFADRQVLFFTEYKATQSLLMSALISRYGDGCITFINGEEKAEGVKGHTTPLFEKRENAAKKFNEREVRFLVSTEAGGEGIDLQENCYSLIHIDLPWNPMRLHQRVGRLNRYGQKHIVEVVTLRNPDTVETRIWDKLNQKIENIMQSLDAVMAEPEDLLELVLGMTSPKLFQEIFSEANGKKEDLNQWFDRKTAKFGGKDAIATVREMVGSCDKFDFQQASPLLPQVDLPDLRPFFINMLHINKRRITQAPEGLSFITPDDWLVEPAIQKRYENMHFERSRRDKSAMPTLLGVGHRLFAQALQQAIDLPVGVTCLINLEHPLFVFRIADRVTSKQMNVRQAITAITGYSNQFVLLKDWQLLQQLNQLSSNPNSDLVNKSGEFIYQQLEQAEIFLRANLHILDLPFQIPTLQAIAIFYPACNKII